MELLPVFTADGEGVTIANVKYMIGEPRPIRFDAKAGIFNVDGKEELGKTLTFQPVAWEFFYGNILNMGAKNWVEFFYLDEKNRLCSILFHGNSVNSLKQVQVPLFYDYLTLADVVLTVTPEKKENTKIQPRGIYYIAEFSYTIADPKRTNDLAAFAASTYVYREGTVNDTRQTISVHGYRVPEQVISRVFGLNGNGHTAELPAAS